MEHIFRNLIGNLSYTSTIVLTPQIKTQSHAVFSGLNLKSIINIPQQNQITKYALWLMENIKNQKGGMIPSNNKIIRRGMFYPNRHDVTKTEGTLHRHIQEEYAKKRRDRIPPMSHIFILCLLTGIALFLIIQSYQRLMDLSLTITETTEDNKFFQVLNDVLKEENINPNQVNDGGFAFYIWNSLAKVVNLNRMPTQNDADIVRLRLMQEITHDVSSQLSKGFIQCGGVLIPRRDEYPVGIKGNIAYNVAANLAAATNFAGGSAPFFCASSIMGTKTSLALTKFMADSTMSMAIITSKITVIKSFMTYAFYILGFVVPSAFVLIKNALSDDIALIEYRENLKEGEISMNITRKEKSPETTTLRIDNAGRRFKNKVTKRRSKQIKRTKTRRF